MHNDQLCHTPTPQRNDPCPCGSGKKFKQCCLKNRASSPAVDTRALFHSAVQAFESGQLEPASAGFLHLLALHPAHADALHYLGLIDYQRGHIASGIEKIVQSVSLDPDNASFLSNLGAAYAETGQSHAAIPVLRRAIQLNPNYVNAHSNLGMALQSEGKLALAISCYRHALALAPRHENALYNLGVALFAQREFSESTLTLLKLLEIAPHHADAISYLGVLSERMGDIPNAIELLRHAIALAPNQATYYLNLAIIYDEMGATHQAIECMEKAAALPTPYASSILCDTAILYDKLNQTALAEQYAQRALALNPNSHASHLTLGNVYYKLGQIETAIAYYRRAIELAPNDARSRSNLLYALQYSREASDQDIFEAHVQFGRLIETPLKAHWTPHRNLPDPARKLKVGYVSADFNQHSLAMFIQPILAHHDRQAFSLHCYYNDTRQDAVTQTLKTYADQWVPCLQMTDNDLAAQIERDGIDILVDLSGHTRLNRLPVFARKPAPIQITWLGYAGTTGLSAMDYRLTDQYLDPPGVSEPFNTEQLLRLSTSATLALDFTPPEITPLPSLSGEPFTFACLNAISKISEDNIALWAEILKRTPGSRIMLGSAQEACVRERLIALFARNGIDEQRLILQPRLGTFDYLALYHHIDVALDPYPYNGGTTTVHALIMGTPVISLSGKRPVSRCGATILGAVGLSEFLVSNTDQYIEMAEWCFNHRPELSAIRQSLRQRWFSSPMGDAAAYTREVESAYRSLWQKWCAQQARQIVDSK